MVQNINNITLITGNKHTDERGVLSYFNDFNMYPIKRMYLIEHSHVHNIRAWQGHKIENKWFYVLKGAFKLVFVKPDDWYSPSTDLDYEEYNLEEGVNKILHIPGGYASGIKATKTNSKLMVFSNLTVEESSNDNFKFNKDFWYRW
ncbi:WxcM-like domain-containing protein [Mucilaginibacter arboris]|uniref:Sugar epimerase n=1 Tax=Mucilaginibacter arboris TaxID=2682090 RepID=A0A7K1SUJ0_9SPHI|nr:WxcM-like domain-containing protein [Mucilaginibacter arboris]MVN21002.1 hypothetical protein [Mucilaginibacter arboris]